MAALWVIVTGAIQLIRLKGTSSHKALGWSWMMAMLIVAGSSFVLHGFPPTLSGFSLVHFLSLWVVYCVYASIRSVKEKHILRHKTFAIGAYAGAIIAGVAAISGQSRLLHQVLFQN